MGFKTVAAIGIAVLLTVLVMQNNDEVPFHLLFSEIQISKLLLMLICFLLGVMMGALLFRSSKKISPPTQNENSDYLDLES